MNDDSAITLHNGGTTMTGDAVLLYRAAALRGSIDLYIKIKMIPTRGVTIGVMLKVATSITKKPYKNTAKGWKAARDDLEFWCQTMRSALPVIDERKPMRRAG